MGCNYDMNKIPIPKRTVKGREKNNIPNPNSKSKSVAPKQRRKNKIPDPKCTSAKLAPKQSCTSKAMAKPSLKQRHSDPQMCEAYAANIYDYIHNMEMEARRRPMPGYIEKLHKHVCVVTRNTMIIHLVEAAEHLQLLSETLHLAVSYMDRFLSTNVPDRPSVRLLAVSSLLIAMKYEETCPPDAEALCSYFGDSLTLKQQVVRMEADVLKALNYEMGCPTVISFLRRLTEVAQEDYETPNLRLEFLAYYLAELSLLGYRCLKFLPSVVAASATFLARFTLKPTSHPWNLSLEQNSGYKPSDLKECVRILHFWQLYTRAGILVPIGKKYKQRKFKCVSELSSPSVIPVSSFDDVKE